MKPILLLLMILIASPAHSQKLDQIQYHLELIVFGDIPAFQIMKREGVSLTNYELVMVLERGFSGYACNKKMDIYNLQKLQTAFDELLQEGIVMKIRNAYTNNM